MRAALFGFLGGLAALVLVGAVVGVAFWRYQAASPERERAALVADLDAYAAWYEREQWRNIGVTQPRFESDRDRFIEQRPRLKQYILWYLDERAKEPNAGSLFVANTIKALRPTDLRNPALVARYSDR